MTWLWCTSPCFESWEDLYKSLFILTYIYELVSWLTCMSPCSGSWEDCRRSFSNDCVNVLCILYPSCSFTVSPHSPYRSTKHNLFLNLHTVIMIFNLWDQVILLCYESKLYLLNSKSNFHKSTDFIFWDCTKRAMHTHIYPATWKIWQPTEGKQILL